MLENFIYAKEKSLFEEALNNGEVLDEAIVFIEDTKEIWNHGTYFDGNAINLKTINGESISGEGDIVIEGGAKVYTWNWDGESESVTLSQEEYDNIVEADIVILSVGGIYHIPVVILDFREELGGYGLVGRLDLQGIESIVSVLINISTKLATFIIKQQNIPTRTSQLENDSNFVSSDGLKTINGESIVGSGDITVQTDLTGYATETYVNEAVSSKQGIIDDLDTIRSGAALGATAVQPAAISDMETKTNAADTYATKTELENKQDQNLYFTNVAASSWVSDSTYPDYPYRCDLACSGVTSSDFAVVVFSLDQANGGNYAPICETKSNIVSIWSSTNSNITIPTITIQQQ